MILRDDSAAIQFFGLVPILSLPFYALGLSGAALPFVPALPISALMAGVPMLAAMILVLRQGGRAAAGRLLVSAFSVRTGRHPWLVLVALGFMPVAFAVTGGVLWLSGADLPGLHLLPARAILPAFVLFFVGAVGEEIGWQVYAYPSLSPQHSSLKAALIIGVVWALWHVIPFALMGRSAIWILWHGLTIVLMRILIVWLVLNTGQSLIIAVLFHMMSNSVWGVFPDFNPFYDPMVMCGVLLAPVAVLLIIWGPNMLIGPGPGQIGFGQSRKDRKMPR